MLNFLSYPYPDLFRESDYLGKVKSPTCQVDLTFSKVMNFFYFLKKVKITVMASARIEVI
jgi:hypothetical protein